MPVGHPQAEGQLLVVGEAHGRHGEAGCLERDAVRVLTHHEDVVEARSEAERPAERTERLFAAGWYPELGWRRVAACPEARAEDPRHEVAPVVEVEVCERDRVDARVGCVNSIAGASRL